MNKYTLIVKDSDGDTYTHGTYKTEEQANIVMRELLCDSRPDIRIVHKKLTILRALYF